jgi:hypothetical protein
VQWAPAEARCLRQLRRQDRVLHTWVLPAALKVSSCEVLPRMCLQIEVTNSQGEGSWASWQPWNIPATLAVSQTRSCRLPAVKRTPRRLPHVRALRASRWADAHFCMMIRWLMRSQQAVWHALVIVCGVTGIPTDCTM